MKIGNGFQLQIIFEKKLHRRYWTGSLVRMYNTCSLIKAILSDACHEAIKNIQYTVSNRNWNCSRKRDFVKVTSAIKR